MAVATQNGRIKLDEHDFKLLYSRRGPNEDRIVARLVAMKNGVITAKIEPVADGKSQKEAFQALRRHIEVQLDQLLQAIPDGINAGPSGSIAGPSVPALPSVPSVPSVPSIVSPREDAPPAYSSAGIGRDSKGPAGGKKW